MTARRAGDLLAPALWAIAAVGLPLVYGDLFLHERDLTRAPLDQAVQLIVSTLANLAVLTAALTLSGEANRRLTRLLSFALMVHGVQAGAILGFRLFYLKSWFCADALVSLLGGAAILALRHKARRRRLAVIHAHGRTSPLPVRLGDVVVDPRADLTSYDMVLLTDPEDLLGQWAQPLSRAMLDGKPVRHWADYLEESRGRVSLDHFQPDRLTLGSGLGYRIGKRLFDLGAVLLLAPLALPVLFAAMAAVGLGMGRPIFFTQMRVGRGGQPFRILKLRTMRPSDPDAPARPTQRGDPRITPVGRVLRRLRIDELPQFWNVLAGDMSLIGPRPEVTSLAESYARETPAYAWRHLVQPGMSGWAQVHAGYAGDLAETQVKLSYDLFYVKNLSFALDVQILARTLWTLLTGAGAR